MEENREKSIVNKVVVVTGGSRGIGAQILKTLANENYKVILNYNNSKEQAEKIQQELLEQGNEIEIIKADVSKREETEKLIQFAINKFNKIRGRAENEKVRFDAARARHGVRTVRLRQQDRGRRQSREQDQGRLHLPA